MEIEFVDWILLGGTDPIIGHGVTSDIMYLLALLQRK